MDNNKETAHKAPAHEAHKAPAPAHKEKKDNTGTVKEYAIAALPGVAHTMIIRHDALKEADLTEDIARKIATATWHIGRMMAEQEKNA